MVHAYFAWFLLDDSGFAAGYDYWDAVIVYTMVYYSKYYVLLWFTTVNITFCYGVGSGKDFSLKLTIDIT